MRPRFGLFLVGLPVLVASALFVWATSGTQPFRPLPDDTAADRHLRQVLPEVKFDQLPLEAVIERLRQASGANLFVIWRALHEAGVEKTAPVSVNLKGLTLGQVLGKVLDDVAVDSNGLLDFTVHDGVIVVTSIKDLPRYTFVRSYDLRDLVDEATTPAPDFPPGANSDQSTAPSTNATPPPGSLGVCFPGTPVAPRQERVDEICRLITETVSPDVWRDAGGTLGSVYEFAGRIVVVQTSENHRQIRSLLYQLRHPEPAIDPQGQPTDQPHQ
jgi:hypothetical protein